MASVTFHPKTYGRLMEIAKGNEVYVQTSTGDDMVSVKILRSELRYLFECATDSAGLCLTLTRNEPGEGRLHVFFEHCYHDLLGKEN